MFSSRNCLTRILFSTLFLIGAVSPLIAATTVTLQSSSSPSAGQPGVTTLTLTGSNYPSGTIPPANVTITMTPATSGAGPSASIQPTAVTTIVGSSRRMSFQIPTSIQVSTPTSYQISVSGTTSSGIAFISGNEAALTINPAASISVSPNSGQAGQTLTVTINGQYTNFVQGASEANFGAGISVAGGSEGGFGLLTVTNPTTATAQLSIDPAISAGLRTIQVSTGVQKATLSSGFTVSSLALPPVLNPIPDQNGAEGKLISFQVSGSDQNGYTLTFSATGLPLGATFDPPSRTFAWTPVSGQAGNYTVTFTVNNGFLSASQP
ncbi:MAG: putative Ig domain-containing protein, partial [Nitrospiria bacterium]